MPSAHAFISYVHENRELVLRLTEDLRSNGVTVWLDRNDIKPGQFWKDAINEAIQNGAYFIACFSEEFHGRKETFMHGELRLAIDRLRNMPRHQVWFIPVLLNETDIPSHPISDHENLSDIQAVALSKDWSDGLRRILSAMKQDDPGYRRVLHLIDLLWKHPLERIHAINQLRSLSEEHVEVTAAFSEISPILAKNLSDNADTVRFAATEALGAIGPAAYEAVPALIGALSDNNSEIRWRAVAAIGNIGPQAFSAVSALIEALRDQNEEVRSQAADALGILGPAFEAMPALIGALRDENEGVRWRAAAALKVFGPAAFEAAPALAEALNDEAEKVRLEAAEALGEIGPLALSAVPPLICALNDENTDVQEKGAYALAKILSLNGVVAERAVPALIACLLNRNDNIRASAARALEGIGPKASKAVPALIEALSKGNTYLRSAAAGALGAIGSAAAGAIPALAIALDDSDQYVRHRAIIAFETIVDSESVSAIPVLLDAIVDSDEQFRSSAARALGQIGPAASLAATPLIALLGSTLFEFSAAVEALKRIGPSVIPHLIEALGHEDRVIRVRAFEVLESIGSPAIMGLAQATIDFNERRRNNSAWLLAKCAGVDLERAMPRLVTNFCSTDKTVGVLSAIAIGAIGESAIHALGTALKSIAEDFPVNLACDSSKDTLETAIALENVLHIRDERIRAWATLSLGRFGLTAIPVIEKALANDGELVSACAVQSLKRIGQASVLSLAKALSHTDYFVRCSAIVALLDFGSASVDALPALTRSLCDNESGIQDEAAKVLGKIGPSAAESIPSFVQVLCDPSKHFDFNLMITCCNSLAAIGSNSVPALIHVMRATKDKFLIPRFCSTALVNIGLDAVPALIELHQDPAKEVREFALKTISEIGSDAVGAIPALKTTLRDKETRVCRLAAEALARVDKQFQKICWEPHENRPSAERRTH
jgi:HEAT repeat protein